MKKLLLFQVENPIKVKQAVATMKLRVEVVPVEKFNYTISNLVSGTDMEVEAFEGNPPSGSLLLMCGLNDSEIDQVLTRLRTQKVTTTYKAVLTPTNLTWNPMMLFEEMEKEKKEIEARRKELGLSQ